MEIVIVILGLLGFVLGFLVIGETKINFVFPYIHIRAFWRAVGFEMVLFGMLIWDQSAYERGKNEYKETVMKAIEQVQKEKTTNITQNNDK